MVPVRSVVVDFDGTACLHDVAEHLLIEFGADDSWPAYDEAWLRGEIGSQDALQAQASLLSASVEEMIDFAISHCSMDPTFGSFVGWARARSIDVSLASDGFGFYIRPLLNAAGLEGLPVRTNRWVGGDRPIAFPNRHETCVGCGTCKMLAVRDAASPVAFVGEGESDRFGAFYADVVFAKDALADLCDEAGVPYLSWTDFDQVRSALDQLETLPGPVAPLRCPGWMDP